VVKSLLSLPLTPLSHSDSVQRVSLTIILTDLDRTSITHSSTRVFLGHGILLQTIPSSTQEPQDAVIEVRTSPPSIYSAKSRICCRILYARHLLVPLVEECMAIVYLIRLHSHLSSDLWHKPHNICLFLRRRATTADDPKAPASSHPASRPLRMADGSRNPGKRRMLMERERLVGLGWVMM
jgi:hypothetical protein